MEIKSLTPIIMKRAPRKEREEEGASKARDSGCGCDVSGRWEKE